MPRYLPALLVCVIGCSDTSAPATSTSSSTGAPTDASTSTSTGARGSSSESTGADATTASESTGAPVLPECPTFAAAQQLGTITDAEIVETSGVVASRRQTDVLWLHNDSGDGARVFAVRPTGETVTSYRLVGALAFDWEDLALGPGPTPDVDYLYLGDIGDNPMLRAYVTIHRVPEPTVPASPTPAQDLEGAVALDLAYPDGPHDAETLLSDPRTGDLLIVTKEASGLSRVFRATAPIAEDETTTMEEIATLAFGSDPLPGNALATGGDIADDGSFAVVRTYSHAFAWRRPIGLDLAAAFATEPCPLPALQDPDGEAIAVLPGRAGLVTISEGAMVPIWRFAAE